MYIRHPKLLTYKNVKISRSAAQELGNSWKRIPITLKKPPSLNALWHSFLLKVTFFFDRHWGMNLPISGKRCLFFATGMCRHAQVMGSVSASREEGLLPQVLGPSAPSAIFSFPALRLFLLSHLSVSTSTRYESLFFFFFPPSPGIPLCFPSLLLCLYFPSQCFLPEFPFCCCFNLSLTHITVSFSVFTTVWYFPELLWLSWGSSYHCIIQFLPCWKKKKKMLHVSLLFLSMKVITVWRNVIVTFLICFCFCSSLSLSFIWDIWSAIRFLLTGCWKGIYQVTSVASCNTSL